MDNNVDDELLDDSEFASVKGLNGMDHIVSLGEKGDSVESDVEELLDDSLISGVDGLLEKVEADELLLSVNNSLSVDVSVIANTFCDDDEGIL